MLETRKKEFSAFSKGNTVQSFLGKEVHVPNYTRNGRDVRIKIANDTAADDTQYLRL